MHVTQKEVRQVEEGTEVTQIPRLMQIALDAYIDNYLARHPECQRIDLQPIPENSEAWQAILTEQEVSVFVTESLTIDQHSQVKVCGWLARLEEFEQTFICAKCPDHVPVLPKIERPRIATYREKYHIQSQETQKLENTSTEPESEITTQYREARNQVQTLLQRDTSLSMIEINALSMRDFDIDTSEIFVTLPSSGRDKRVSRKISSEASEALAEFIPLRYHYLTSCSPSLWKHELIFHSAGLKA